MSGPQKQASCGLPPLRRKLEPHIGRLFDEHPEANGILARCFWESFPEDHPGVLWLHSKVCMACHEQRSRC